MALGKFPYFSKNLTMKEIAAKRRSENISEYILFLYQMEDLVRAFNFDMKEMEEYVVQHFPVGEEEKEEQRQWFTDLIGQMKAEKIEASGHLESTQAEVDKVFELHMKLLVEDAEYQKLFNAVRPSIQFYLQQKIKLQNKLLLEYLWLKLEKRILTLMLILVN